MARTSSLGVQFKGVNITKDIQTEMESFSYNDNATGTADDISMVLSDRKRHWLDDWEINQGDEIIAIIYTQNWRHDGDFREKNCGRHYLDVPRLSGYPRKVNLKASSIPINHNLKTPITQVWADIRLDNIANDIAWRNGMRLFVDSRDLRHYGTLKRERTSDLNFLEELCRESGHGFKIRNNTIIIYDLIEYMKRPAVLEIWDGAKIPAPNSPQNYNIAEDYDFSFGDDTNYDAVNVSYRGSGNSGTIRGQFIRPNNNGWKVYEMEDVYVSSVADANYLARRKLFQLNKEAVRCSITIMGDTDYAAATCVDLKGFGQYSGKYFVERVYHSKSPEYKCELEMFRTFEI